MANCLYCGTPLTRHEQFAGTICSDWRCREKQLEAQLAAHRAEAADALGVARPESFPIAVVPDWTPELIPLEPERRQALAEFLDGLIAAEPAETDAGQSVAVPPPSDSPAMAAHLGRVCAVCRGYCCFHGAAHNAFLGREVLLRFQAGRPELELREAVSVYLDYLPDRHCRDACLYQGERGCVLPREMRADICNGYECGGLQTARDRFDSMSVERAFVVVRHDHRIQRSAFIDGSAIRHYPSPEEDSAIDPASEG
jgi:hypothetical protein